MTLHVFNPEHDIALASGLENFTSPHAGRQLRHDLGFLPTLWAAPGDGVLVEDAELALASLQRLAMAAKKTLGVTVGKETVLLTGRQTLPDIAAVSPWGWDAALRARLLRAGADVRLLPSFDRLDEMRLLSHRDTARRLLPSLRVDGTVGEAWRCTSVDGVADVLAEHSRVVLKAPWSSSGRGIRFVDRTLTAHQLGWLRNLLSQQGAVMAEPYYNKVKDFGMEFISDGCGHVSYLGLSLFHTANGAYTGNILATEAAKRHVLTGYVAEELLDAVQTRICEETSQMFKDRYRGPFGVDMMVCASFGLNDKVEMINGKCFLLHPCVEINLRRTMGHVALALTPADDDLRCVMRIEYNENNYHLKISKL